MRCLKCFMLVLVGSERLGLQVSVVNGYSSIGNWSSSAEMSTCMVEEII